MVITLLTDFGTSDTFVGQIKGVLLTMSPHATVIDLTHHIPPHHVLEAAIQLDAAVDAFADDTIHIAVVDPGVGSTRRGIIARCACGTFVGPDNGIFTAVLERYPLKAAAAIEDRALLRTTISDTFHGRDVFAPVAAHLANGLHLTEFGPMIDDLVTLDLPRPTTEADGAISVPVLMADRFGNLITALRREAFEAWLGGREAQRARVLIAGREPVAIRRTFADVGPDELVAYFGSSGRLEVAVREGVARDVLRMGAAQRLRLVCKS